MGSRMGTMDVEEETMMMMEAREMSRTQRIVRA